MDDELKELLEILQHRVFKAPVRLAIMVYLVTRQEVYFSNLLEILDVTPGNLWSHLSKLREENYIVIKRVIAGRPRVKISITDKGYEETMKYIRFIKNVFRRF